MRIAVLGLWHLGEIYSACLAELGHTVFGISEDADIVENFRKGIPPLAEPGLRVLLQKNIKSGRLQFSTDFSKLKQCDILWVTLDTPLDAKDKADTRIIFSSLKKALPFLKKNALVVVSSQLPVGTSKKIISLVGKRGYAYVPENLQLGKAVESFMHPGRIVIGLRDQKTGQAVKRLLSGVKCDFLIMNPVSAEMVKHALNSFLAASLSFIYDVADMCEKEGADILSVSRALKSDPRIGEKAYLDASIGFSGGTLGRDLQFLLREGKKFHTKLPVIAAAYEKNMKRQNVVYEKLKELGSLKNKRVALLGLTYKAGTPTLRRSLALEIASKLSLHGVSLSFYDPALSKDDILKSYKGEFIYGKNIYDALKEAHAAVLVTPWKGIEKVNWERVRGAMRAPRIFLDSRNFFAEKSDTIRKRGILYKGIGR